jgi:hypothetical protein
MILGSYITLFCFAAAAVLNPLAYWNWYKVSRLELSHWRNLIGLTAMVIVSVIWVFWVFLIILGPYRIGPPGILGRLSLSVFLYAGPVAALLATGLKGRCRTFSIAAGVLIWAGLQAISYS